MRSDNRKAVITMKLDTNSHSVFLLNYHLILCIKYRRKVLNDEISERLKEMFIKITDTYGVTLMEWNHDGDHIHLLFRAKPNTDLSRMLNVYKAASSKKIKNEFPEIRQYLWKSAFWSKSYCLLTTGGAPIEVIKKYIETQGEKK